MLNMDFVRHDTTRLCTAIGDKGSLRWNGLSGLVEKFEAGGKEWREVFRYQAQRDESYLAAWRHFLDCVEGRDTPLISGEDGLRVLQIIAAARRAAETGCMAQVAVDAINEKGSA
jgi:predicted dehydrogenase